MYGFLEDPGADRSGVDHHEPPSPTLMVCTIGNRLPLI
jgi:hypothetical protein